jgi:porin
MIAAALAAAAAALCHGQGASGSSSEPASGAPQYTMEALNLVGAAVSPTRISDSLLGADSGLRRAMFRHGMLFRATLLPRVSVNLLDAPVPAAEQGYIGQRPTWITGVNPVLTFDLRQLRLRNAQLSMSAAWRWTNWNPAGPKTISLATLYFYKMWGERRVEIKAGYIGNDTEFIGMQVGGSLSTGAQGVYAVLPFQAGMSYFPLTAPSFNLRLRGPRGTYFKGAAQRSLDAAGGVATQARNQTGFRFIPKGDKLLLIEELGYQRASSETNGQIWFRAGYLHNSTLYVNRATGRTEPGNYCAYVLMDYQLTRSNLQSPGHGLYLGGTAMTSPARFNAYSRYYEARLYQKAPWRSRPDDVLSLVVGYRGFSRYVTDSLASRGKTVWRNSPSLTASYSIHVSRGNYLTLGLGYMRGAAITPRVADTLTFTANWGIYL